MPFIKHIGKHGDRRVAIVFRTVPDEEHMALVVYPDNLKAEFHDTLMRVIEGQVAQNAAELSEVLSRELLPDGRQILQTFHKEGMIKKVPTSQIVVTPNATSHVRLDELNEIMNGMEKGGEAAEKLQKLDEGAGLVDPAANRTPAPGAAVDAALATDGVLDDATIAANLQQQATDMEAQAKAMLAESKRLKAEAKALQPKKTAKKKVAKKKAAKKKTTKNS